MAANYTKGPWKLVPAGDGRLLIAGGRAPDPVTRARHLWIAEVKLPNPAEERIPWDFLTMPEAMANAKLIKQAPKLLEMCQAALSLITDDGHAGGPTWTIKSLERVITEAGG